MITVLVVEDDPAFLKLVERMLSTAGYRVLRAGTGNEAVEQLEKHHNEIALCVVDLALPDINGFELIGAMTRRGNSPKVLATTSVYKDAHLEMAAGLGAHAAIRKPPAGKPLPEREWLDTVRRLIGAPDQEERARTAGAPRAKNDSDPSHGTENK